MNRITQFWQKIRTEEHHLVAMPTDQLMTHLNDYVAEAAFDVNIELMLEEPITLIFTAEGILKRFEEVANIVKQAPDLTHFKVVAFRRPIAIEQYHIRFNDFIFKPEHFEINLDYTQRRFELSIAFSEEIPVDLHEEAKNIAYLYLDHGMGEYFATTRIHSIQFLAQLTEKALPLHHFIAIQDRLWREQLAHDDQYPATAVESWDWSSYELVDQTDPTERAFLMRNEDANALVGRPNFSYYIKIGVAVDEDRLDLLYSLEERINAHLSERQTAIHVMNHFHHGIRTMSYYSEDVEIINYIVNALMPFKEAMSVEYAYDPSWSAYLRWV